MFLGFKQAATSLFILLLSSMLIAGSTYRVPTDYATIQSAINASIDGDIVVVQPGTYVENLNMLGKAITLRSADPSSQSVVASTIIDGNSSGRAIYCGSGEGIDTIISGFTIQNASDSGILCLWSGSSVSHCVFRSNSSDMGGGIRSIGGVNMPISDCIFEHNTGGFGGGISVEMGSYLITNCVFNSNISDILRGGAVDASAMADINVTNCSFYGNEAPQGDTINVGDSSVITITNCILWDSSVEENAITRGYETEVEINHSCIQGEWDGPGQNNLFADPLFKDADNGDFRLSISSPCIDEGTNSPSTGLPPTDIEGNPRIIDGDQNGQAIVDIGAYEAVNNCTETPIHVSPQSLTFLAPDSATMPLEQTLNISNNGCLMLDWSIDTGSNPDWLTIVPNTGSLDPNESETVLFSVDITGLAKEAYFHTFKVQNQADVDNYQTIDVKLGVGGILVPGFYSTIQSAIDAAITGDTIMVKPGIYYENINFNGKDIILTATNPSDATVVADTIIDGGSNDSVVKFSGTETSDCILRGFTIKNGENGNSWISGEGGGGILGKNTHAKIDSCVITENSASFGAGLRRCDGLISNCMIIGNAGEAVDWMDGHGGGLDDCDGQIVNCLIADNTIEGHMWVNGGGLYDCDGSIMNCTITNNMVYGRGGGLHNCNGTIKNCIISGNWAESGPELYECSTPTYSYISGDPLFVSGPRGDFYLSQAAAGQTVTSPCVDAGSDLAENVEMSALTTRTDQQADDGVVDMGFHYLIPEFNIADINNDEKVDLEDFNILSVQFNLKSIEQGEVVVDANLVDWQGSSWKPLDQVYWGNPDDIVDAQFALRWSKTANKLYLAMQVEDTDHIFRDDYGNWEASDRIEVYCQATAEGGTGWQGVYDTAQQYYIAPDTAGGAWCSWALGQAVDPNAGLEYAVSVDGDIITYEVAVTPLEYYGAFSPGESVISDLALGDIVGFDFTAVTRSAANVGMRSENLMNGKSADARQFARYQLVDPANPSLPRIVGDLDGDGDVDLADMAGFAENWLAGVY